MLGTITACNKTSEAHTATAAPSASAISFKSCKYTVTVMGYNATVVFDVIFSDMAITGTAISSEADTAHVGKPDYDILFPWI